MRYFKAPTIGLIHSRVQKNGHGNYKKSCESLCFQSMDGGGNLSVRRGKLRYSF